MWDGMVSYEQMTLIVWEGVEEVYPGADLLVGGVPKGVLNFRDFKNKEKGGGSDNPPPVAPPFFSTLRINYPRDLRCLLILLKRSQSRSPTSVLLLVQSVPAQSEWTLLIQKNGQRATLR